MPTQSVSFKIKTYNYIDDYATSNSLTFSKAVERLIRYGHNHLMEQKRIKESVEK